MARMKERFSPKQQAGQSDDKVLRGKTGFEEAEEHKKKLKTKN